MKIRRYSVDLSEKDPLYSWIEIFDDPFIINRSKKLIENAYEDIISSFPEKMRRIGSVLIGLISKHFLSLNIPKKFREEMERFSLQVFGKSSPKTLIGNLSYEICKAGAQIDVNWCSSASKWIPRLGYVHIRNMDWPLTGLNTGTIIVDFKNSKAGSFSVVTIPGYFGVLSGVAKGRFSATINMVADTNEFNMCGIPAAILLRRVFEECYSYEDAKNMICRSTVMANVFIHLNGILKGERCVIEVKSKGKENYIYEDLDAITNHHPDVSDTEWEDSENRLSAISESLSCIRTKGDALLSLLVDPVMNEDTMQSMMMVPSTGEIALNKC